MGTFGSVFQTILSKNYSINLNNIIIRINSVNKSFLVSRARSVTQANAASVTSIYTEQMWVNLIATSDATGKLRLYRDGTEVSYSANNTGSGSFVTDTGKPLTLFNRSITANPFFGKIAEVGIWNRILTTEERKRIVVDRWKPSIIPDGLVSYIPLTGDTPEKELVSDSTAILSGTASTDHVPDVVSELNNFSTFPLSAHNSNYGKGVICSQVIPSVKDKVAKVSLFLSSEKTDGIISGNDSYTAFSCLNFYETSNESSWTIYKNSSSYNVLNTADQGYLTNSQTVSFSTQEDVFTSSPSVTYKTSLSDGTFDVWCRCGGTGTFWYAWDGDVLPSKITLTSTIKWQFLGRISNEESQTRNLVFYLGSANLESIKLDEVFIYPIGSDRKIDSLSSIQNVTGDSYNTFVRVRNLLNSAIQSMPNGVIENCHFWLPSHKINTPEWYNYSIPETQFDEGLSIDFTVISGSSNHPRWLYATTNDNGTAMYSTDWGVSFNEQ